MVPSGLIPALPVAAAPVGAAMAATVRSGAAASAQSGQCAGDALSGVGALGGHTRILHVT